MADDDQGDILLDWAAVKEAARGCQRSGGDRQAASADRVRPRRSPPAKRAQLSALIAEGLKQGGGSSQRQLQLPLLPALGNRGAADERAAAVAPKVKARPAKPARRTALILFPLARRRAVVARIAAVVAAASTPEAGENLLRGRLARAGRALARKKVPKETIKSEIDSLELAVRTLADALRIQRRRYR